MDRLERYWLSTCVGIGVPFCLVWFIVTWHEEAKRYTPDAFALVMGFVGHAIWSFVITLFLVGIPSRVAMNLIVRDRRRKFWKETLVLFVTFGALCWMFYSLFAYPSEG